MRCPALPVVPGFREVVEVFRGYNHTLRPGSGEFYHMKNLTSDHFPVLSPREKRGVFARPASPQAILAREQLCWVDGEDFLIGRERFPMGLSTAGADCPKMLTSMGAYVIILPDKKYINTAAPEDRGSIEQKNSADQAKLSLWDPDGEQCRELTVSDAKPQDPADRSYWLDTAAVPQVLRRYSQGAETWIAVSPAWVRIDAPGIGQGLFVNDAVELSGLTGAAQGLNGTALVRQVGEDHLCVEGLLECGVSCPVTVERSMPQLDFLTESENRLWGCRWGRSPDGRQVNEIYACALGDFRNWSRFQGLSTDSYRASCGSDGPFTGAVTYLGNPLFFKETCVHRVYGSCPENFGIQTTVCRGVRKGCHRSLAIVGETLFYKSVSAVCAYDGSLPVEISAALGQEVYGTAVAGGHRNKYYISMEDEKGNWHLFVYDTARGMWHREDDLHALGMCALGAELYCIDADSRNILTLLGSGEPYEQQVCWEAETGDLGLSSPDRKYVSRLLSRLSLEPEAVLDIYIQYERCGQWLPLCTIRGTGLRSFSVPVSPRRSDHLRLKFVGRGSGRLYAITRVIQEGSDWP